MMKMTTLYCPTVEAYTVNMNLFAQPIAAPKPKTPRVRLIAIALAAVFVVMAVAQLYSFEDFPAVIADMELHGDEPMAGLFAALLVTGEVLAVPFLLGMRLSPAMRVVSMVAGWLVIVAWLKIAIYINVTAATMNGGVLGATIPVPTGWWMVCIFVALGVMSAWASWGMWPFSQQKKD